MVREFGFETDNGTSMSYGLRFLEYPVFVFGTENIKFINIPGRADPLTNRTGTYSNTIIKNKLEFVSREKAENCMHALQIESWLKKIKTVKYSDLESYFFKVKKVKVETERKYGFYGVVNVEFECDPSIYLEDGKKEITMQGKPNLYNQYSPACPIYKITGEGMCTLTVNGKTMKANVGQNLTIDTENMLAYRQDGTLANTSVTGDYEDLYLKSGNNTISISPNFALKIIPNWRCL